MTGLGRSCLAVVCALAALPRVATAAPDARALIRCQRALDGAGTAILVRRAERLGACFDAVASCGAPAVRDPGCTARALARCERRVAAIGRDEASVVATITRRCAGVAFADVLATDGLGYARPAAACGSNGIPVDDTAGVAQCAAWTYGRHVAALLGDVPGELVDIVARGARGGFQADAASIRPEDAAAESCRRATQHGRARYARAVLPAFGSCVERTLACAVRGMACDGPDGHCVRQLAAVAAAARRLENAVGRGCGVLPAETAYAAACIVGRAVRDVSPRAEELLVRTALALDAAGCGPIAAAPTAVATATGAFPTMAASAVSRPSSTPGIPPTAMRTHTPVRTPAATRTASSVPTPATTPSPAAVVHALAIDPAAPSTVYAGVDVGGVFASLDRASNWTLLVAGLTNRAVRALVVDPARSATLYAATAAGVFRSTDRAGSWTLLSAGLTVRDVQALALDPSQSATLYAGTNGGGVFRSDDGASSWTPLSAGLTTRDIRAVTIDPVRPGIVYAGTNGGGVFRSDDRAASWTTTSLAASFATARAVRALAIDPEQPATVYAGTDGGGVFKSADGGATWTVTSLAASFVTARAVRTLVIDPATPATLYAGSDGGGLFKSRDGGVTWTTTSLAGSFAGATSVHALALDPENPRRLYAGTAAGAVFRSTDGGGVWSFASAGLPAQR